MGEFDVNDVVQRCHKYEVLDYNGAGGNMDQFACAHGGIHRFGNGRPEALKLPQGVFILGDSGEPKDTQGHLRRCKDTRIPLMPFIDAPRPRPWGGRIRIVKGNEDQPGFGVALGKSYGVASRRRLGHGP